MKKKKTPVSLFIVGQPKSGTTALSQFLDEHPEICMALPKEPHYFATDLHDESDAFHGKQKDFNIRTEKQYEEIFSQATDATKVFGEASTGYLYSKKAAENIAHYNPNALIVVLLREPVSFLHSLHMQYVNESTENESNFEKAIASEPQRKKGKDIPSRTRTPSYLFYSERIKYAEQLQRFMKHFPKKNILVFTMDEFRKDNVKVYQKVVSRLPIDQSFLPDFRSVHESKTVRLPLMNKLLHTPMLKQTVYKVVGPKLYTQIHKNVIDKILMKKSQRSTMDESTEKRLRKLAQTEVEATGKLLGRDLAKEWHYK